MVAEDPILREKALYLNTPFFLARAAACFAVWIGLALLLTRWSAGQDRTGDPALAVRMRNTSAVGMVLYFLTMTVAAIDWPCPSSHTGSRRCTGSCSSSGRG